MRTGTWHRIAAPLGFALVLIALGATPVFAQAPNGVQPHPGEASAAKASTVADVNTFRQHLMFLANPFMEGRGPGTRGNEIAAEYIVREWRTLSLDSLPRNQPEATGNGAGKRSLAFRQEFTAGTRAEMRECGVNDEGAQKSLGHSQITADHRALGFSASGRASGPLVFVGYAIQKGAPEKSYNSFADGDDLAGTIAVMLRFEPMTADGVSRWKSQTDTLWSPASGLASKIQEVLKRNPAGLVIVNPPGAADPRASRLEETESTARWMHAIEIPAVLLSALAGDDLVRWTQTGRTLADLRAAADERGGIMPLGDRRAELVVEVDRSPRTTWNVCGVLPGSGALAEQYIIIGAHYDHVGYGYTGGSRSDEYGIVHPGADDNASGTSGLLLAAEIIKRRVAMMPPGTPRRSVMFIAFSAEEMGLVGSREFIKNCPVPASAIYAMLNMDMIGRLRNDELEISGTGTAEGFDDILKPLFDSSGLRIKASPGGRGPSDHATFYGSQVPVLAFFSGMHGEYHTPRDTVELINCEGAVRVVDLVCDIAHTLALRPEPLVFKSTDKAGARDPNTPAVSMGNVKVRFGIAPGNYADAESGVLVGEVFPGTCAAEAGILAGDRLMRWNGEPIADVANWMEYLAKHSPGDTVDVGVDRKGEDLTVRVTLKTRDQAPK